MVADRSVPLKPLWLQSEESIGTRSSTQVETMAEVQLRADLQVLAVRLAQEEHLLLDMRKQIENAPKAAATELVDTRRIDMAPTLTSQHQTGQGGQSRCVPGICKSEMDRSTALGCDGREHSHVYGSDGAKF